MVHLPANKPSSEALDALKAHEGLRLKAYPDPGSKDGTPWTIGYGSTGPDVRKGTVWTKAQADSRFERDVTRFAMSVAAIAGPCSQGQLDALVSLAYNIGFGAFKASTLLRKHLAGDHDGASEEFGRWNKNDGKVMNGLVARRADEAARYLSDA